MNGRLATIKTEIWSQLEINDENDPRIHGLNWVFLIICIIVAFFLSHNHFFSSLTAKSRAIVSGNSCCTRLSCELNNGVGRACYIDAIGAVYDFLSDS